MLGTTRLSHFFQNKFNFKNWFSSKLSFRTWAICVLTFLLIGIGYWKFVTIKGIFLQASGADPVAYWKFNEGVGSTVNDAVGTNIGSFGSGNSAPTWKTDDQCINEKCLYFDGTNDYVNVADDADFNFTEYTISLWMSPNRLPSSGKIFTLVNQWGGGGAGNASWIVDYRETGLLTFGNHDGSTTCTVSANTAVSVGRWTHITAVYMGGTSGTNGLIYINGKLDNSGTLTCSTQNSSYPVKIGLPHVAGLTSEAYSGKMDEIKVYNYARSASQIKSDYAGGSAGLSAVLGQEDQGYLSDGLVGYWKMDEIGVSGSNWTAIDSSGNNNSGTGAGNVTVGSTAVGKFGNAGFFDGNGDYISMGTPPILEPTNITISAWIKTSTGATDIVSKWQADTGKRGPRLTLNSNNVTFQFTTDGETGTSVTVDDTLSIIDDIWHNVVATYDRKYVRLYVDGVLRKEEAHNDTLYYGSKNWEIGRQETGARQFVGLIDEVRIYNQALDPSEVKMLYSWAPGPVGYWKMDDGSGSFAVDSSGVGNTASLASGNATPVWLQGKYGSGLEFDGGDYITTGDITTFDGVGAATFMSWVRFDRVNFGSSQTIMRKWGDWNGGVERTFFLVNDGGTDEIQFGVNTVGVGYYAINTTSSNLTTNRWYHVAGVWNGGNSGSIYIDGIPQAITTTSATTPTVISNIAEQFSLGASYNNGSPLYYLDGALDEAKVYNYARTQAQIVQDMNAGHPAPGSPIGSAIVHYRLDEGYGTTINNVGNAGSTLNGTFGTGNSAPTWTNDGKFGKALSFDGTSDYVNTTYTKATGDGSISVWVKGSTQSSGSGSNIRPLVQQGEYLHLSMIRDGHADHGKIITRWGSVAGDAVTSTDTYNDDQWHHVVLTNSNAIQYLYIDGQLIGTAPSDNTLDAGTMQIGGSTTSADRKFKGQIDEIKIYDLALTADQVKVEYNQGKALVLGAGSTGLGGTLPDNSAGRSYCVPGDSSSCSAPSGEWLLNEGIGNTANDTSGNGYVGSLDSTMTQNWVAGKKGEALNFDGVDDDVQISSAVVTAYPFTMSGWFQTSSSASSYLMTLGSSNSTNNFQGIRMFSGQLYARSVESGNASDATTTNTYNDNSWHHVVAVFSSATDRKIYVDGILQASDTTSRTFSASINRTAIGGLNNNSETPDSNFAGKLDEVRIYNYARTLPQIAWEYNQGKPIAWYRLDECTGSTAYNAAKNANGQVVGMNGTITIGGSGTQTSTGTCSSGTGTQAWNNGTTGKFNGSLNFDGVDDYITIADDDKIDFNYSQDFSVSIWFTTPAAGMSGSFDAVIEKWPGGATGYPYSIRWDSDEKIRAARYDQTNNPVIVSRQSYMDDDWHHIVFTKNGSTLSLYIDGKLDGTTTDTTNTTTTNSGGLEIAKQGSNYYAGQIDEIKIYNYALTAAQVKTDKALGAVRFQ